MAETRVTRFNQGTAQTALPPCLANPNNNLMMRRAGFNQGTAGHFANLDVGREAGQENIIVGQPLNSM